jgi:c-di-GMP-binding flagellar brake protein YcgR
MDPLIEIVEGQRLIEMLHGLIDSRKMCRMEIPHTNHGWITLLLGIDRGPGSDYLLIDQITGFEKILSHYPSREISLEFLERDGVPCRFRTRVAECGGKVIRTELPRSISRMQKRKSFRTRARSGAEILFHRGGGKEGRARVKDYSLGGVSFFVETFLEICIGEELTHIALRIPWEDHSASFDIPRAVVRRLEDASSGNVLCAIEFLEMPGKTKELLWHHLFEEERVTLRKTRKS